MDTYENDPREYEQNEAGVPAEESTETAPEQTLPFQFGEDTAPAQKRSPFEESPYRTDPGSQYQYGYTASAGTTGSKKSGAWKGVLAAVLTVTLVAGSCFATAGIVNSRWEKKTGAMEAEFESKLQELEAQLDVVRSSSSGVSVSGSPLSNENGGMTPAQVYESCKRSVVAITNTAVSYYYGQSSESVSSGSGFILSEDGYIVSNHHVIENANKLTVTTYDGKEYTATLVGSDETNDIALLKIEAEGLQAVKLGSSDALIIGDQVVAIGNPLGELTSTQTVGYISGKDREVSTDGNVITMLQTDAAINSGNSGGPLFNMKGEVVGITTAKYSGTSSSGATIEGIGFAIPIDDVTDMLEDLRTLGYVSGAYLGVMVRDFDTSTAQIYNLPVGAYVDSVTEGSCAQKGGIQAGDMILSLGEHQVESISDLTRALRQYEAGDTVEVTVFRSGGKVTLSVTLDEKPHDTQEETPAETQPSQQYPSTPGQGDMEDWMEEFYDFIAPFYGRG